MGRSEPTGERPRLSDQDPPGKIVEASDRGEIRCAGLSGDMQRTPATAAPSLPVRVVATVPHPPRAGACSP